MLRETQMRLPALPGINYMTLGKLLNLADRQTPRL